MEDPLARRNDSETANPQSQSVLYHKIPTEIRWMIYELALEPCDEEVDIHSRCTGTSTAYVPLLLTSKLVSQESKAIKQRLFNKECHHHRIRITLPLPDQDWGVTYGQYNLAPLKTEEKGLGGKTTHDPAKFQEIRFITAGLGEDVPSSISYHFNPPNHVSFTATGDVDLRKTGDLTPLEILERIEECCAYRRDGRSLVTPLDFVILAYSVRAAAVSSRHDDLWFSLKITDYVDARFIACEANDSR